MKFSVVFEVEPEGIFGVPQAGTTVLPAGVRDVYSDTYTNTGVRTGHGTLPEYRLADQAVQLELDIGQGTVRIEDNFFIVVVDADDHRAAYQLAIAPLETLLAHLAIDLRNAFSYRPLEIRDEHDRPYLVPTSMHFLQVTHYNLAQVAEALEAAGAFVSVTDSRLDRALHYFEHALFLFARRRSLASPFSRHHRTLISAIFLNLWKSVSTIVGDPSRDADYQKRYRQYGMDRTYFLTKIERLRKLRNDFDVAHYHLSSASTQEIESRYGEAVSIAAEVIKMHRDSLAGSE